MQFLSVRCLNCSNVDDLPRMRHDDIPYCSQCSSTSNLVPEPRAEPAAEPQTLNTDADTEMDCDLAALFNRHLILTNPMGKQPPALQTARPLTPPSPTTSSAATNFSISQHYHHSSHLTTPPSPHPSEPSDPASAQLFAESQSAASAAATRNADREYAEYLMGSDLSSPTSLHELQIAVAHGIISPGEYSAAIDATTHAAQIAQAAKQHAASMQQQQQQQQQQSRPVALAENCSAMDLLSAAATRKGDDPVFRSSEWFNDYYGGMDTEVAMAMEDDESAPCSVAAWEGSGGCRLQPFDY